eukprot:s2808_g6.t1
MESRCDDDGVQFEDRFSYACSNTEQSLEGELDTEVLWRPFSALEPVLDSLQLQAIDEIADKVERQRLRGLGVIISPSEYTGTLGKELSAKMVRTWRKKSRAIQAESGEQIEVPAWMRRSSMVAREVAFLEQKDDTHSPSSCAAVTKVLPALALSDGFVKDGILATADISDAYLQVPALYCQAWRCFFRDIEVSSRTT